MFWKVYIISRVDNGFIKILFYEFKEIPRNADRTIKDQISRVIFVLLNLWQVIISKGSFNPKDNELFFSVTVVYLKCS